MPIRTNRGRSAVYRRIWGWPLRSPRHLVMFLVGLAIIGIMIASLLTLARGQATQNAASPTNQSQSQTSQPSDNQSPVSDTSSPGATRLTSPLLNPTSAPASQDALNVATQWGRAWVNHPAGITTQQWLDQLKPFTTDEYLPTMNTVDVNNISATKITGPPSVVNSTTSSVVVNLPTDNVVLQITVVLTDHQGWRVSHYTQGG